MLRTLIVEDEPLSRLYLSHMLSASFPELEVIGYAATEAEALAQIQQLQPDLIFLDIELQWGSGFGVVEKMAAGNTQILFTTALDPAAGKLLYMSGARYLQKPIDAAALAVALHNIQDAEQAAKGTIALEHLRQSLAHDYEALSICLLSGSAEIHAPLPHIVRAASAGEKEAQVVMASGEIHTAIVAIRMLESLLEPSGFYRSHPEHLINTAHVAKTPHAQSAGVEMQDGSCIPVSPRKLPGLLELLG